MSAVAQHHTRADDMQTQSKPRDSLARRNVAFWLLECERQQWNAMHLYKMLMRRKDGPDREALWSGYFAVEADANVMVERLRDLGGLLFVGQPAAIKAAQELEGGAA